MSRAAQVTSFGGLESVQIIERDVPTPGEGEVLVRMTVAGFHPLEALIAAGGMPFDLPLPLVLGAVGAGRVESDGATLATGDRVVVLGNELGMFRDGIWADHAAVPERLLVKIPDNVDDLTAASLGIAFPTAVIAADMTGVPVSGGTLLVLGATGAVGSAAVQVGKAAGLRVVGAARTAEGAAFVASLGADDTIDLSSTTFPEAAKALTEGGFDGTVDPIGGQVGANALKALKPGASQVVVGYSAGFEMNVFLPDLVNTSARLQGGSMMSAGPDGLRAAEEKALAGFADGSLRASVAGEFALEEIAAAAAVQKDGVTFGRVLLRVS